MGSLFRRLEVVFCVGKQSDFDNRINYVFRNWFVTKPEIWHAVICCLWEFRRAQKRPLSAFVRFWFSGGGPKIGARDYRTERERTPVFCLFLSWEISTWSVDLDVTHSSRQPGDDL